MNLVIDIGNTSTKVGWFEHEELLHVNQSVTPDDLGDLVAQEVPKGIMLSSVSEEEKTADYLRAMKTLSPLMLTASLPLPFTLDYQTPATLGNDRIAAVAGAQALFPGVNALVIDCGTCITYDFLSKGEVYLGGSISPGMTMRFKALNTFTANLPLTDYKENVPYIGKSTQECLRSGVIQGIIGEMNTFIDYYQSEFDHLKVIMCGGDTKFFENKVKARIFAAPELVLRGLNRILRHNAE